MPEIDKELAEEFKAKMIALQTSGDTEAGHGEADEALCDLLRRLGYGVVVDEYDKIEKWYA